MLTLRTAHKTLTVESLNTPDAKLVLHSFGGVSITCDGCTVSVIQGLVCHEAGCPNAWRDERRECKWCGQMFAPENKNDTCCCACCTAAYNGHACECSDCRGDD